MPRQSLVTASKTLPTRLPTQQPIQAVSHPVSPRHGPPMPMRDKLYSARIPPMQPLLFPAPVTLQQLRGGVGNQLMLLLVLSNLSTLLTFPLCAFPTPYYPDSHISHRHKHTLSPCLSLRLASLAIDIPSSLPSSCRTTLTSVTAPVDLFQAPHHARRPSLCSRL